MFKNIASNLLRQILSRQIASTREISVADDVIFENVKDKGIVILNRPKALNALNLSMVNKLYPTLMKWENEKKLVIVKGSGDKSFCSGADVKSITIAGKKGEIKHGQEFFKNEYKMNGVIGTYKIPYIAFIDGIVMGGGVGLSVHGQYRVATERTVFAMPETQIGLFPDVGTSYFLPRLRGKLGLYLALTGVRLKGYDVFKANIATHYVDSKSLVNLQSELLNCSNTFDIDSTFKKFSKTENAEFSLAPFQEKIDKYFSSNTVEEITNNLKGDKSPWSQEIYTLLLKMSPTSMKVAKELLDRGSKLPLHDCLKMEYCVACNVLDEKDFYEGVRALLIDKDQKPNWNPPRLEEVPRSLIEKHFIPVPQSLTY